MDKNSAVVTEPMLEMIQNAINSLNTTSEFQLDFKLKSKSKSIAADLKSEVNDLTNGIKQNVCV